MSWGGWGRGEMEGRGKGGGDGGSYVFLPFGGVDWERMGEERDGRWERLEGGGDVIGGGGAHLGKKARPDWGF